MYQVPYARNDNKLSYSTWRFSDVKTDGNGKILKNTQRNLGLRTVVFDQFLISAHAIDEKFFKKLKEMEENGSFEKFLAKKLHVKFFKFKLSDLEKIIPVNGCITLF